MKRLIILIAMIGALSIAMLAQKPGGGVDELTYHQVNEIRNQLHLDRNQFDKVYKAYHKYNTEVFGSMSAPRQGRPGGGMGPGGHGGHGGPGGQHMGGGRPPMGGEPGMGNHHGGNNHKKMDPAKREQLMKKQEEKLHKSMKKILKAPGQFARWLELRKIQLSSKPQGAPQPRRP